jgi:hypothetical protein
MMTVGCFFCFIFFIFITLRAQLYLYTFDAIVGCKRAELLVSLLEIGLNKLDLCSNQLLNELLVSTELGSIMKRCELV